MQFIQEYRRLIKRLPVEEPADYLFYRPLAYLLVLVFKRSSITPNQISLISMAVGFLAAWFLSLGDRRSMIIGGCMYGLANVIDCTDGMIARLKKNGAKTGRIVDGAVDYLVGIAISLGYAFGLMHARQNGDLSMPLHPWPLILIALASTMVHCILSDKYRSLYESHVYGKIVHPHNEWMEFEQEHQRLKKEGGSRLNRFLIRSYLYYCRFQAARGCKPFRRVRPDLYARYNNLMVMLWNLIGPAMHITLLVIAAIFYKPQIFFWYAIVFANLWIVLLFPIQEILNRKLVKHS